MSLNQMLLAIFIYCVLIHTQEDKGDFRRWYRGKERQRFDKQYLFVYVLAARK